MNLILNVTEIIAFLSNGLENSAVGAIAGGLFTAIFLRHNTKTEEFEKIKAGQFKEVADDLLASGKMTYTEYYKANNFTVQYCLEYKKLLILKCQKRQKLLKGRTPDFCLSIMIKFLGT